MSKFVQHFICYNGFIEQDALIRLDKVLAHLIMIFRFFYYTAGSGGAGPTILATSFLLLGEDVIAYIKGQHFRILLLYSHLMSIIV